MNVMKINNNNTFKLINYHYSGTKGGGVFILVKDTLVASRQKTLETDCEVIWVKTEAVQSKPVYLAAYYRPHENDFHSFEEFCKSVDMLSKKNGHIWILGDFIVQFIFYFGLLRSAIIFWEIRNKWLVKTHTLDRFFMYLDPILIYISLWIDCLFEIC